MRIGIRGSGLMGGKLGTIDHDAAKETAASLIRDAGFNPVNVGALKAARFIEPLVLLVAELAYNGTRGPEVAYRFQYFGK
jgi:predicted dinucleotide-binding enzyme